MRRLVFRALLVCGGVGVALAAGEGWLRSSHSTLPSLAALEGYRGREPFLARFLDSAQQGFTLEHCDQPPPGGAPVRRDLHGQGSRELTLLVAGDSVAHGWGVSDGAGWADHLADTVARETTAAVELVRTGAPGQGYCNWVAETHGALDSGLEPDLAVLQVFADDIEQRGMVLIDGEVAAVPGFGLPVPARELARRSYLANRLWFAWATHFGKPTPDRIDGLKGRAQFLAAVQDLGARFDQQGTPWTVALVAPAGRHLCDEDPRVETDCRWLEEDGESLARWLDHGGVPWVDLRTVWQSEPSDLLDREIFELERRHRLPVHPGPAGHRALAVGLESWASDAARPALVDVR